MTWWDEKKKDTYKEDLSKNRSLFVVDEPSDEDDFGFEHYTNTLEALVRECETPFVVGLLGKWGVGKTTLIKKFLKTRLKETEGIGFVYFDAWKYQKDAFYRQFLKQMKGDLEINDDSLFIRFYKTIKRTKQTGDLEWNMDEVKNIIFEFIAWYIGWYILAVQLLLPAHHWVTLLTPLIVSAIISCIHRAPKLLQTKKFEEEDKPLFSNEQFEDVFREYVKKANNAGNKRIVITIDNLDRCTNETAVELLGTIKTFLNVKNCIYIVPVDEEALINHLKEGLINGEGGVDKDKQSREFLKKFFQATIRLSPFIRGDLEKYIDKIANDVAIPYKDNTEKENVASLVLTAYSHTPRKIKQFYNNLSASYLLATAQEEKSHIDKGFITGNLSFLAKLIILQEEWPKFFALVKIDPEVLSMTEGSLRGRKIESQYADKIQKLLGEYSELADFLQTSRPFNSRNPEQFINFKREGYGGHESEDSEMVISLFTGKAGPANSLFKGSDEDAKLALTKLIEEKLVEKKRQGKSAVVLNILSVIESVFSEIPDSKKTKVANLFASHLADSSQLPNAGGFTVDGLLAILEKTSGPTNRDIIINEQAIGLDNDNELFIEYGPIYAQYNEIIPAPARKKLADTIQKAYQYSDEKGTSYIPDVLECLKSIGEHNNALGIYANNTVKDLIVGAVREITSEALNKNQKRNLDVVKLLIPFLSEPQVRALYSNIHHVLHEKSWGAGTEELAIFVNELVLADKVPQNLILEVSQQYSDYINSPNIVHTYYVNFLPAVKKLINDSQEAKVHFIEIFKTHASHLDISRLTTLFNGIEEQKLSIRDKLISPLVARLSVTNEADSREAIINILKAFGALQNGQLYISALKDAVLLAKDFEITNHLLAKLGESRPLITEKDLNEMIPKLLEWGDSLDITHSRKNMPYRFMVPSFTLINEGNKEKVIDAWSSALEKGGMPVDKKNEIGAFLKDRQVIDNFPISRKEGLPRKIFDIAKNEGIDGKEVLLETLASIKSLYGRKIAFVKELKSYAVELEQNPEESREHKLGKSFSEKLD